MAWSSGSRLSWTWRRPGMLLTKTFWKDSTQFGGQRPYYNLEQLSCHLESWNVDGYYFFISTRVVLVCPNWLYLGSFLKIEFSVCAPKNKIEKDKEPNWACLPYNEKHVKKDCVTYLQNLSQLFWLGESKVIVLLMTVKQRCLCKCFLIVMLLFYVLIWYIGYLMWQALFACCRAYNLALCVAADTCVSSFREA